MGVLFMGLLNDADFVAPCLKEESMVFNTVINCGSYLIRDDRSWSSPLPCPPHVLPSHSKAVPSFFSVQ